MKILNNLDLKRKNSRRIILAYILIATIITLTSHIYIQSITTPILQAIQQGVKAPPPGYPLIVMISAYGTALITTSLLFIIYYYTGHILKIKNYFIKILTLTALILEVKGALIREPLMNYIYNLTLGTEQALWFSILSQLDKWIPNLLLSACLVYFSPLRYKGAEN